MYRKHSVRTLGQVVSVILLTVFIVVVGLSCFRKEPMPVIVDRTEDVNYSKLIEQTIDEEQNTQEFLLLPKNHMNEALIKLKMNIKETKDE